MSTAVEEKLHDHKSIDPQVPEWIETQLISFSHDLNECVWARADLNYNSFF